MREVIEEIVEVLKRHDIDVEPDSAQIEVGPGSQIVFRCRDLNREAWERRYMMEIMDRMKMF